MASWSYRTAVTFRIAVVSSCQQKRDEHHYSGVRRIVRRRCLADFQLRVVFRPAFSVPSEMSLATWPTWRSNRGWRNSIPDRFRFLLLRACTWEHPAGHEKSDESRLSIRRSGPWSRCASGYSGRVDFWRGLCVRTTDDDHVRTFAKLTKIAKTVRVRLSTYCKHTRHSCRFRIRSVVRPYGRCV